jgi:DNA-binding transcriptional MerR regulator
MPLSRSRDYLSIGEVIQSLKADFPDISISKVRFLESEGLIEPERTPSGYRKFYDDDVKRLRYILALQRDHFLPLKVIRDRLDEADHKGSYDDVASYDAAAGSSDPAHDSHAGGSAEPLPATVVLTRRELLETTGLEEDQLRGLEEYGVIARKQGHYDENDLMVAKCARRFFDYGVEPRHLRMYKQIVDRETAFVEQVVSPLARKGDEDSRRKARNSVQEMVNLSRGLREGLLRAAVREIV